MSFRAEFYGAVRELLVDDFWDECKDAVEVVDIENKLDTVRGVTHYVLDVHWIDSEEREHITRLPLDMGGLTNVLLIRDPA